MKRSLSILFVISLSLSSCFLPGTKGESKLTPVTINYEYSMDIPAYMTKVTSLNAEASLQFQNVFRETYVIVIDEVKEEFLAAFRESEQYDSSKSLIINYADIQMQQTSENMTVLNRGEIKRISINGLEAANIEMDGEVEGVPVPISYFFTFIEGKEKLYMVMAWTLQNKKETHKETFTKMMRSFKVL